MAFEDKGDLSRFDKDVGPVGHGKRVTGTLMAALMGHGYREKGETHMGPIMERWKKACGMPVSSIAPTKAMEVGKTMEEIAYAEAAQALRKHEMGARDEKYGDARLYEAYRGLYLEDQDIPEGKMGYAANIDGALIDVSGEYTDPRNDKTISGRVYAELQAREVALHDRMREDNLILEEDGEPPNSIPEPLFTEKLPWMGTADIKVTMSEQVLEQNRLNGIPSGWVVQTHHYNKMLREENARQGHDPEKHANLIAIYQFCTATMSGNFYEIEHDPELEKEMDRRAEAFEKCVQQGIPPNSSEMAGVFYEYPVKRPEPEAITVSEEKEAVFNKLDGQIAEIDQRVKKLKGFKSTLESQMQEGVAQANRQAGGTKEKAVLISGGNEGERPALVSSGTKRSKRTEINRAEVDKALQAGQQISGSMSEVGKVLQREDISPDEMLELIQGAYANAEASIGDIESGQVTLSDFESQTVKETREPVLSISRNKNIDAFYERYMAEQERSSEAHEADYQAPEAQEMPDAPAPHAEADQQSSQPAAEAEKAPAQPEGADSVPEASAGAEQPKRGEAAQPAAEGGEAERTADAFEGYQTQEASDIQEPEGPETQEADQVEKGISAPESDTQPDQKEAAAHADDIGLPMNMPGF